MRKKILNYSIIVLAATAFLFSCNNQKNESEDGKEMGEKTIDTITKPKENPYANAEIEIKIFKNDTIKDSKVQGYGYDIYISKTLYVHQPHMPAVSGNRGFDTEEQAHKTGELIAYKIKNNIMPPSVTPVELDSIGVLK